MEFMLIVNCNFRFLYKTSVTKIVVELSMHISIFSKDKVSINN